MKIQLLVVALTGALGTSTALAQTQEQQQSYPMEQAAPSAAVTAKPIPPLTLMQQRLEEMQSHWQKMIQTTDPVERQQLVQEHQEKMQELGAMLRQAQANSSVATDGGTSSHGGGVVCGMMAHGGGMACGGMDCGGMSESGPIGHMMAHHAAMMFVFRQLEKRVDLLQTTVEQLLADEKR
jgi:hypothetical protein